MHLRGFVVSLPLKPSNMGRRNGVTACVTARAACMAAFEDEVGRIQCMVKKPKPSFLFFSELTREELIRNPKPAALSTWKRMPLRGRKLFTDVGANRICSQVAMTCSSTLRKSGKGFLPWTG